MKGKKVELAQAECGIARALQVIGDWWSLLIVREAFRGKERFSEFEKSLGLAKNILSTRLKKLVEEGVLEAVQDEATPSRNRYLLTSKGEQLSTVLVALWQWGERHCTDSAPLRYAMVDSEQQMPLAPLELHAQDGRVLGPRGFQTIAMADLPAAAKRPSARKA